MQYNLIYFRDMKREKNIPIAFRFTKQDKEIFDQLKERLNIKSTIAVIRYLIKKELGSK
jgi:hypothetical protein